MDGVAMKMDDDRFEEAAEMYRTARQEGQSRKAAKRLVRQVFPSLATFDDAATAGEWGRRIKAIERELAVVAATNGPGEQVNGNGDEPSRTGAVTVTGFSRSMFLRWVERAKPAVGDKFTFSSAQWLDAFEILTGRRPHSNGFHNEFLDSQKGNSQLQRAGWKFATAGDRELYEVTIVEMPAPPAPPPAAKVYTEAEVQQIALAAVNEAMARMARMMGSGGRVNSGQPALL